MIFQRMYMFVLLCVLTGDPEQDLVGQSDSKVIICETLILSLVVLRSTTATETDLQSSRAFPHRHPGIFRDVEKLPVPSP